MKICIAGKNSIAVNALIHILGEGVDQNDILVCTNSNDVGVHDWQPSLKKYANDVGIVVKSLEQLYEIPELIFLSLEFDRIIKPSKFLTTSLYNIHFSILPAYKGMYTSVWPILNAEVEIGVTLHKIDRGIDTGDVIDQIIFNLALNENAFDLYIKFLDNALVLFKKNWKKIKNSIVESKPQSFLESSYYSKKTLDFSKIIIDFNNTAYNIYNQIRAFSFRPYQLISVEDVNISHAVITNQRSLSKVGTITNRNDCMVLSTIDYDLSLYKDRLNDIIYSAEKDDIAFIENLLMHGYNLDEKNKNGWTALIVATYNESRKVFDLLISKNANVNTVNNNGTSVLMYALTIASNSGDLYYLKKLIENGAIVNHKDLSGVSIFDYAKRYGNNKVINFIYNLINK